MKLVSIMLMAFALQLSARSMAQTINYSGKNVAVQQVFAAIKAQTSYKFFYRNEDLTGLNHVTLELKQASLEEALRKVLNNQPLDYSIEGNTIFITRRPEQVTVGIPYSGVQEMRGDVKGVITDIHNNRLSGITVVAKEGKQMTVSGEHGQFLLRNVKQGDSIIFSSINYERMAIPATFQEHMVVLNYKVTALSGVKIVYSTGYQEVSRERATGAFAQADMKVFQQRATTNDILSRLDGQIAGLTVMPNTFNQDVLNPGVQTNKVVIRGLGSVNSTNDPIYVVNGVIVTDFSTVNPQDIEDITVLKDAAAAAIYGARASNGVIVVRTRDGQKKQRLQVNYAGNYTFSGKPHLDYVPYMNSRQFIETSREIFAPDVYPAETFAYSNMLPHTRVMYDEYLGLISSATADHLLDSMANISNRGQIRDMLYRNAMLTNHTVSASGGTDNYSFYASLGYTGVQSPTPGERDNSYKFNVSQQFNVGKRVTIGLNTTLINRNTSKRGGLSASYSFLPYQLFKDGAGNDLNFASLMQWNDSLRNDYQSRSRVNLDYYPLIDQQYNESKSNALSMNLTANVTANIWRGLSYQGVFGYIKNPGTQETYTDNRSYMQRMQQLNFTIAPTENDVPQYLLPATGGMYSTTSFEQRNWTVRNQLVYDTRVRQGRDALSLQAGQEVLENFSSSTQTTLLGYDRQLGSYPLIDYATLSQPNFGTVTGFASLGVRPFDITTVLSRFRSYFALGNYTFDDRYSLDLSWRRDQSNLFGADIAAQNKPAYSIGGKWQINKEQFMQRISWVNELGLRLSYGVTGNSPAAIAGNGTSMDILNAMPQSQSGSIAGDALTVETIANPKLTWEATRTINAGLNFRILQGRLHGVFNYYQRKTEGLLATLRLNPFSGFAVTMGNLGDMENKGIDLELHAQNIIAGDFRWSTDLIIGHNRNKLLSLGVPSASSYSNTPMGRLFSNHIVGYSAQTLFSYRYAGLDNMGDPLIYLADKSTTKAPNIATVKDMVYSGTTQPVVNGGFRNTFDYKGWSLGVNMVYSFGHVMRADVNNSYSGQLAQTGMYGGISGNNLSTYFLNRWKQPGDEAKTDIPSYVADMYTDATRRHTNYYVYADRNVLDASYVKVRDITLSYDLQPAALRLLHVKQVNVFVQAGNFMVWKANDRDIDPEFISPRGGGRVTPAARHTYTAGLNVTL
ncbi:SusC/RagA family TonB-linked outer membrane protein [Chitinophaga horti]|uniref:SusC/RagA family TonB-linked outer membrane protein n=1 Tax=Chitinophaga horti TaxID=2920382 RepID=A0ABY6J7D2_9BACT|nr:SusC/RagA family TonB-linked outer membrane protein [Chitinophaga horti]UYQ94187.1 SusC/RagA family TonB-linked outer membrane protein [Chitinophaga horti]